MATVASARSLSIAAALTAGGLSAANSITSGKMPKLSTGFGALGLAVGLTALAGFAPGVAAAFAVTIILTALLTVGAATITRITRNVFN
jgi:hypothetical protein